MQAYAEGFEIMHRSAFSLDLSEIAGIWRYGSVVRSWLLELLHQAIEEHGDDLGDIAPLRRGFRRGPVDDRRRDRRERAGSGDLGRALRPLLVAARLLIRGQGGRGAAQPVRRPRRPRCRGGEGRLGSTLRWPPTQENPLLEGLPLAQTPEPCVVVIFGASGDLTKRKIFPALYALALRRLLPENFAILGAARSDWTDEEFRRGWRRPFASSGATSSARTSGTGSRRRRATSPYGLRRRAAIGQARERLTELDDRARHHGQPRLLPGRPARLRCRDRAPRPRRAARPRAGRGSSSRSRSATTRPPRAS